MFALRFTTKASRRLSSESVSTRAWRLEPHHLWRSVKIMMLSLAAHATEDLKLPETPRIAGVSSGIGNLIKHTFYDIRPSAHCKPLAACTS